MGLYRVREENGICVSHHKCFCDDGDDDDCVTSCVVEHDRTDRRPTQSAEALQCFICGLCQHLIVCVLYSVALKWDSLVLSG